jgi:hypothetical protein
LDVICPAIALLEVKTSQIARQVIRSAGDEMPDWGVDVVAGSRCVSCVQVVVVAGLKLGIERVPAVRHNMPPIVAYLTLGALAAAVVLIVTPVIVAVVLATTGLATGRLTAIGSSVALATIRAAIAAVARARLVGAELARSTSRVLRSARPAGIGVGAGTRGGIRRGGPICGLILLLPKGLE